MPPRKKAKAEAAAADGEGAAPVVEAVAAPIATNVEHVNRVSAAREFVISDTGIPNIVDELPLTIASKAGSQAPPPTQPTGSRLHASVTP